MPSIPDIFAGASGWRVFASGQAKGELRDGPRGALRLDYDFRGGGGFVAARREASLALPPAFRLGLALRASGPSNSLEIKFADPSGANVWRHAIKGPLPRAWKSIELTERDFLFAWGPAGGGAPSEIGAIEIVVVAGKGGRGDVALRDVAFFDESITAPEAVRASSSARGFSPEGPFAGGGSWCPARGDKRPSIEADFGRTVRFGGVVIAWADESASRNFVLEIARRPGRWEAAFRGRAASGPRTCIPVPRGEARAIRIRFSAARGAAVRAIELMPDAYSSSPQEFIHSLAADAPRGHYPRYWLREQSYWTIVGNPRGTRRALVNEEGMVECDEGSFSLEPFLLVAGNLVTWADARPVPGLARDGLPLPSVAWRARGVRLEVHPWVDPDGRALRVLYRVRTRLRGVRLVVALRPFQVTPPWQAFRGLGGRSDVGRLRCTRSEIIAGGRRVLASMPAHAAGTTTFIQGDVTALLASGRFPSQREARDEMGLASAAMAWDVVADPFEVTLTFPYSRGRIARHGDRAGALAEWESVLCRVGWRAPSALDATDCFRTAAGHILINRAGPALQPGGRRYTRSWVRDGVIMGAALAKAGIPGPLRDFVKWYAAFQRDDGFVPCVVDRDGVDWLVEHDSHGQFLWGAREAAGADAAFAAALMPPVTKAADYLCRLLGEARKAKGAMRGLLPESASHEGYLAHPVHSYWDDFWAVRGLESAAELASICGHEGRGREWRTAAERLKADTLRSMRHVIDSKKLRYVPGSVEWADFDPTATANAVALLDFADELPAAELRASLSTYLEGFRAKQAGATPWVNYSAYEIRILGALARLGQRDAAVELLNFFLSDRRPRQWNQWPEISWRDPLSPGHLGDLPHTWIAAEYILSVASMVAHRAGDKHILAAGLPWEWMRGGFVVKRLPVEGGELDLRLRARGRGELISEIGGLKSPAVLRPPLPRGARIVSVTGPGALEKNGRGIELRSFPAKLVLRYASA